MAPTKPLNPSAKEWKPDTCPSLKQISHDILRPDEIYAINKQKDSNTSPVIYYSSTPYTHFWYFQTATYFSVLPPPKFFPQSLELENMEKDEISLKEGERVLKKVLNIDEEKKKTPFSRHDLPPRLRKGCLWDGRREREKYVISKRWRVKNSKPEGKVVCLPSPPPPVRINTTVMMKNIPNQFRKITLMEFLDPYCLEHQLEYDFFYLPMDFRSHDNLGFAFINFTTAAAALKAKEVLAGYKWGVILTPRGRQYTSKKICEITWARIQGKDALVEHFEKSCFVCDNKDYLPVVITPPRNGANAFSSKMSNVGRILD